MKATSARVKGRLARKQRIRKKFRFDTSRPRLVVYRSLHHIYAQIIDDVEAKTLAATSTKSKDMQGKVGKSSKSVEAAQSVGKQIAELAKAKKIEKVRFDRNGFLYHGRVKALADAARENGLQF